MSSEREDTTSDAVDYVTQRKERGRIAQRAFRQRQIDTIAKLKASNLEMQAAIAAMTQIAARIDDPELEEAARNARRIAGLGVREEASCAVTENPAGTTADRGLSTQAPAHLSQWPAGERYGDEPGAQNPVYQIGRMSPRLGYGIWMEPVSIDIVYPPPDIFPYLEDRRTLSNVLFWAGLSWGLKILQASLAGNAEATATAWEVFGSIPPLKPDREVLRGIQARLIFRATGSIAPDHPGNAPELAVRLKEAMASTCEANGTPLETFLPPPAVENSLREKLGDRYSVMDRGLQGLGTPETIAQVCGFIETMVKSSICLGDGPRWSTAAMSQLDAWLVGLTLE